MSDQVINLFAATVIHTDANSQIQAEVRQDSGGNKVVAVVCEGTSLVVPLAVAQEISRALYIYGMNEEGDQQ